ncbi:hypothetical protein ACFOG5_24640 [Pedobacter fastidiosus]
MDIKVSADMALLNNKYKLNQKPPTDKIFINIRHPFLFLVKFV